MDWGGSWRSWNTILAELAGEREVIAVDLPGFGATPPLDGEVSIRTLADAVTDFLHANDLIGIDVVGSSMGARLVLELARRGGVLGGVPGQAKLTMEMFPDARLHWFKRSGHFSHWDEPQATARLILDELSPNPLLGRNVSVSPFECRLTSGVPAFAGFTGTP